MIKFQSDREINSTVKRTTRERENRQLLHFFLLVSTYSNGPETWSLPPVPQRAVGPELTILDCGMPFLPNDRRPTVCWSLHQRSLIELSSIMCARSGEECCEQQLFGCCCCLLLLDEPDPQNFLQMDFAILNFV